MRKLIFLIITCMVFSGYANWEKIGQDINGETADDRSGRTVSLSSDGTTVPVEADAGFFRFKMDSYTNEN